MKGQRSNGFPMRPKRILNAVGLMVASGCISLMIAPSISKGSVPPLSPESIERAVHRALLIDEGVPAHLIDVALENGVVSLSGIVPHLAAKERATRVTETIKGVQSVLNHIKVSPSDRSDSEIQHAVIEALQEDPATDSLEIHVTVRDGTALLAGRVPSLAAKELAREITAEVWGVEETANRLTVNPQSQRNDRDIQDEISSQMENNVWINENPIQITVQQGVVTLKGVVGSLAEKRRVRRAAMVNGVTSVNDDGLFVKKWAQGEVRRSSKVGRKTDEETQEILRRAFRIDPRISLGNLDLEVHDGVVTLHGKVPHLKIKQAAKQVAKHTRGVLWVKNFIKVRPETIMSDEEIEQKVAKALENNAYVNTHDLAVSVVNGRVYIAGTAHSHFERKEAERTVSNLRGVIEIENQIVVKDVWTWKPDTVIQKDIQDEFWWSPFVNGEDISVKVTKGTATLKGTVDSWWEQELAVHNAYEGGAKHVDNQLVIQ